MQCLQPVRFHRVRRLPAPCWLFLLVGLAALNWSERGYGKVEADPNNEYFVTPAQGPWMIIVQSYSGELAKKQAHELVMELRSNFDMPSFIFNRGKEEREKQEAELQRMRQQQKAALEQRGLKPDERFPLRLPRVRIEDQYAVLVGGYKDMDAARRMLDEVKKLKPPSKHLMDSVGFAYPDPTDKEKKRGISERAWMNPFRTAFVVPNPTVPRERPEEKTDPLLKELNADESYSLLKCSKPWTLAVKEFYGQTTVAPKNAPTRMLEKLFGGHNGDTLNASALQAHEVAKVLHDSMSLEAYVLHTRYGSIVAVGSYETKGDPKLLQNQRLLANFQLGANIQFFAMPLPMEVPRTP